MRKYHRLAWDEESKQRQRDRIMTTKPWLKSTGAKTEAGKAISKMNALKVSPELHTLIKEMNYLMKHQKEILSIIITNI